MLCRVQPSRAVADPKELLSEAEKFSKAVNTEDIDSFEVEPDNGSDIFMSKLQQQYKDLQKQV